MTLGTGSPASTSTPSTSWRRRKAGGARRFAASRRCRPPNSAAERSDDFELEVDYMHVLRRLKFSPALVLASIALAIALGGTGYAATQRLPRNSVTTYQVKDFSLLSRDFKRGQIPAGPIGPTGATGPARTAGPAGHAGTPDRNGALRKG